MSQITEQSAFAKNQEKTKDHNSSSYSQDNKEQDETIPVVDNNV